MHQIGWQLRLGEHIEGRRQEDQTQDIPPATEEEIEEMRSWRDSLAPEAAEALFESMRQGTKGEQPNNAAYGSTLPASPFENTGRPSYEAQDRELLALKMRIDAEEAEERPGSPR